SDRDDRKATESAEGGAKAASLSLVDYDQMEENMLLDRFAARIRNAADEQFGPLTQRLAAVLKVQGLTDRENPFHPIRFCRALGEAVDKLGFKGDQRLVVVKAFDGALAAPLIELYRELNKQLQAQGVEERNTAAAAFKNTLAGFRNTFVATGRSSQMGNTAGAITGATAEQLLSALYQRMKVPMGSGTAPHVTPVVPATGMPPQPLFDRTDLAVPAAPVAPGAAGFGNTGMFPPPGAAAAPGTPVQFAAIDPGLLASINEVQRLNALAAVAARSGSPTATSISERDEAQLRAHVAEKATKQIDKLVIELVGMLFDRIHQDKHLPAEIKTALSRLQFPIMKVALSDSELFVSPLQPARRLMDRIASTAVGWIPEGEENQRYLVEVNKAVDTVVVAINEGPSIFEKALEEFEKYLNEERSRDDDPVTRAKRALEEAETREVMSINAAIAIRRAFDGVQLESYLREFMLDTWVKVMVAATLRERAQPDFAKKFRDMVPDLIWSVQPKINPDDRKRLVKTIPAVLNTLREGLQLIDQSSTQTQEFFSRLMASHAQAVKALEVAYGATAPVDTSMIKKRLEEVQIVEPPLATEGFDEPLTIPAAVVRSAAAANHAEVNVLDAPPTVAPEEMIPVEQLSDQKIDAMIEDWERGAWFDLYTGQQVERVRLRWISPRRNFYLFTSAETGKAHSLAPLVLRGYVRAGRIRSAEGAPLFERVVGNLMRDLGATAPEPA
ncbi:MAG TPA: DUF1631 family protein, partial [Burkholderiaceae bacterium]|nr:DUF1631 family protein [Burkholderiaceae bacterium]